MARQCIYCGRTLEPGETCNCRSTGGTKSGSASDAGTGSGTQTRTGTGTNAGAGKKKSGPQARSSGPRARPRARRRRTKTPFRLPLGPLFRRFTGFLRSPVDTAISFSADPRPVSILFLVVLEAVGAALLVWSGSRSPMFYLAFTSLGFTLQGAGSTLGAVALGALQSFLRIGLLSGVLYAYIRWLLRRPVPFRQVAASVAPACGPMAVILTVAAFSAGYATVLSISMIALGLMLGMLLMFFTFRNLLRMPDNHVIVMLVFAHLLYFSLLALLVGPIDPLVLVPAVEAPAL